MLVLCSISTGIFHVLCCCNSTSHSMMSDLRILHLIIIKRGKTVVWSPHVQHAWHINILLLPWKQQSIYNSPFFVKHTYKGEAGITHSTSRHRCQNFVYKWGVTTHMQTHELTHGQTQYTDMYAYGSQEKQKCCSYIFIQCRDSCSITLGLKKS